MIAVGVYGTEALQSLRFATARLLVAISLGVIFLSFIAFVRPGAPLWRSNSLYAMTFAFLLLIFLRILLDHFIGGEAFKRRLIVLCAVPSAERRRRLAARRGSCFSLVGSSAMHVGA